MSTPEEDVRETTKSKSDQLNADDLLLGPIQVQVIGTKIRKSEQQQPWTIHISGGHMPFKPCLTMRRLISHAWGEDYTKWDGRWMVLYRDPDVVYAGKKDGGIRIQSMSHLEKPLEVRLTESKGKKKTYRIEVMPIPKNAPKEDANSAQSKERDAMFQAMCQQLTEADSPDALTALAGAVNSLFVTLKATPEEKAKVLDAGKARREALSKPKE